MLVIVKLSISAFFDCVKCILNKTHPTTTSNSATSPLLFCSTKALQNGLIWPSNTKDHGAAPPQAKELGAGQVLPGGDWTRVLPTQKLIHTNLATPESFTMLCPPVQKLVHIIRNTKTPNHEHHPLYTATGGSNQNIKIYPSLKIRFQVGSVLYKNANFSKKITPSNPYFSTLAAPHLGPKSKFCSNHSVCLVKSFQKWYDTSRYHQKPQRR